MNCDAIQEDFLDTRAGRLPPARLALVREHLRTCITCQRAWADFQQLEGLLGALPEPAPSDNLRRNFHAMLDTHLAARREPGVFAPVRRGFARWAAAWLPASPVAQAAGFAVLLSAGAVTTLWIQSRRAQAADLAALRQQVDAVTRLVATTALDQQPASDRVRLVLASDPGDSASIAQRLNALALDPNVNVRLSALDALFPDAGQPGVRSGVLAALSRETSPIVQVAMIDFLSAARATEAQRQFARISRDPGTHSTVRAAATRGLGQIL